jgi:hypothetical protein
MTTISVAQNIHGQYPMIVMYNVFKNESTAKITKLKNFETLIKAWSPETAVCSFKVVVIYLHGDLFCKNIYSRVQFEDIPEDFRDYVRISKDIAEYDKVIKDKTKRTYLIISFLWFIVPLCLNV